MRAVGEVIWARTRGRTIMTINCPICNSESLIVEELHYNKRNEYVNRMHCIKCKNRTKWVFGYSSLEARSKLYKAIKEGKARWLAKNIPDSTDFLEIIAYAKKRG